MTAGAARARRTANLPPATQGKAAAIECVVEAGQMLYLPAGEALCVCVPE